MCNGIARRTTNMQFEFLGLFLLAYWKAKFGKDSRRLRAVQGADVSRGASLLSFRLYGKT